MRFLKSLYLTPLFFTVVFTLAAGFLLSYWIPGMYRLVWVLAVLFLLVALAEVIALYRTSRVSGERILPEQFSNSDPNPVEIRLFNHSPFPVKAVLYDEIPIQFQERNFRLQVSIPAGKSHSLQYTLTPYERGEYVFGKVNLYCSTRINLVRKRITFGKSQKIKTYPSVIQMKKLDFMAIDQKILTPGIKKIRKIGHTMEFEQIREYVRGDDVRSINWKATAKNNGLMVNQYQDERSQPVYSIIDTGRTMKMPFDQLKLLDYAINSSLALSNIVLKRKDRAGLVSFSKKVEKHIPATSKPLQLRLLLEHLYKIETQFLDSDFGLLYNQIKKNLTQRSLIILYTNFEHISALHRQLPYLQAISKKHLLVVVFFENTELGQLAQDKAETIPEIFDQTIADQLAFDKRKMARELQNYGIQTILTKPQELSVATINKYLEIKKRGIL